jgi:DNA polymerase (family X)
MKDYKFSNKEIIALLKEVEAAMQVKTADYNFFQIRAYQNVIASIENLTSSVFDLWEHDQLNTIPGIGGGLTQHLNNLFTKGKVEEFEKALEGLPDGMFGLIGLRSVGAKRAFKLASEFELLNRKTAIDKLKKHAEKGHIQKLDGFAEKSEKDILNAIEHSKKTKSEKERMLYAKAEQVVERVGEYLGKADFIDRVEVLGSFRRKKDTVGDIEFAVVTKEPEHVMDYFVKFPEVEDVLMKGDKRSSVVLKNDVQVDFRVSKPEALGSMVQYFTGNKQHNILLRQYALDKGMSLSEYGIKKGGKLLEFSDEKDFYKELGLQYIEPELRHGWDEIELAKKKKLPDLVELDDIKGDIHTHTTFSDGVNTLSEMAAYAQDLGYEYIGISDHAPSVQSRGYDEVARIIEAKRKEIDSFNEVSKGVNILYGYEVNILVDATLAMPDDLMEKLDYVIAGVHTSFNRDKDEMTKRLVAALKNPHVNVLAHPTGRLLNERPAYDVDWEEVLNTARDNDKILEIDANPNRLDLTYDLVKRAVDKGVKIIITTDAHEASQMLFMKYGVSVARRGWCTKKNILNTLPYNEFVKSLGIK